MNYTEYLLSFQGGCRDSGGLVHLTCLEYASDSVLYVGTSHGQVSAWDTRHNTCFLHWQAAQDNSHEIGQSQTYS